MKHCSTSYHNAAIYHLKESGTKKESLSPQRSDLHFQPHCSSILTSNDRYKLTHNPKELREKDREQVRATETPD